MCIMQLENAETRTLVLIMESFFDKYNVVSYLFLALGTKGF